MKNFNDLSGQKIGRWTVLHRDNAIEGRIKFICQCDCGTIKSVRASHLINGKTKSCGCSWTKHSKSHTNIYRVWDSMIRRCHNVNHPAYKNYGARGITVCEEWKEFSNFYSDMGDAPEGMTLERVDNSKGYSKSNVVWATFTEQARNRRCTKLNEFSVKRVRELIDQGVPQSEIATEFGCSRSNIGHIAQHLIWR